MSLVVGERVMHRDGEVTGTLEQIRPSSSSSDRDYLVAEVLWDTGARCAEPLAWLARLEDVQAAEEKRKEAAREAAKEQRRLARVERHKLPERECDGCIRRYVPTREGQRFHSERCRKRARYLGI